MSLEILCRLGTHLDSKDAIIILLYFLFSHLNGSSVALLAMLWLQRIEVTPIFNHRGMPLSHHLTINTLSRPALIPPPSGPCLLLQSILKHFPQTRTQMEYLLICGVLHHLVWIVNFRKLIGRPRLLSHPGHENGRLRQRQVRGAR